MDFGWLQGARSDGLKVLRLIEAWLRERGHPWQHVKLGMSQIIQANRWTESMRNYLEQALMEL